MSRQLNADIRFTRTTLILTVNGQEEYYTMTLGMYMSLKSGDYDTVRSALRTMTPYRVTEARP